MDKIKHYCLILIVYITFEYFFKQGILSACLVSITIELAQAEYAIPFKSLKYLKDDLIIFRNELFKRDTLFDLIADGAGLLAGMLIMKGY